MVNKLMLFRGFYTLLVYIFVLYAGFQIIVGEVSIGIYNIVICVIWIVYLYRAEKVKNTLEN